MKVEKWLETVPALKFCVIFIAGILTGYAVNFNVYVLIFLLILLILLNLKIRNQVYVYVLIFIFGLFKANLDFYQFPRNNIQEIPDSKNLEYTFRGVISEYPEYFDDNIRFVFESDYILSGDESIKVNGNILASIRGNKFSKEVQRQPELKAGDYIEITGEFSTPKAPSNPFEFDYRKYLYLHDIHKTINLTGYNNIKVLEHDKGSFLFSKIINPARSYSEKILNENYRGDNRGFTKGLITGNRTDISSEMKTSFIDTGIMHIIAVSGLNVAYVILLITLCLSIFRIPKNRVLIITIPLLILYCLFTGATPSIVRATIMGILFIIAYLLEKKIVFYNIVAVSAIAILIYDSKQLFDAGFILSYVSLISMVFIYESVFRRIEGSVFSKYKFTNNFLFRWVFLLILISTAAIIGTIPVSAAYFGKISIVSVLANIIAVPIANFVLATGFVQILFSLFSDYLSNVISYTNNFFMNILFFIIDWLSSLKIAYVEFYKFTIANILITYAILILLATMRKENCLFRLSAVMLLCIGIFIFSHDFKKDESITFLDIHNADAVLVNSDNAGLMLYSDKNETGLNRSVSQFLKKSGNDINVIIRTDDADSIISMGQTYKLSDDIKVYLLTPAPSELNNVSALIRYRDKSILYLNNVNSASAKYFFTAYRELLNDEIVYVSGNTTGSLLIPPLIQNEIYITSNDSITKDDAGETGLINLNESGAIVLKMENGGINFFDWRN